MMKYFLALLLLCSCSASAPFPKNKKSYKIHTLAFYNVENLFDPFDDPEKMDELSPIMKMKPSQRASVYKKKLHNLAKVISDLGYEKTKNPPTLLGLCEIENAKVLEDLLQNSLLKTANYDFVNTESPDVRSIDVALLYRQDYFSVLDYKFYTLRLYNSEGQRIHTRDLLVVSGYLEDELIYILVNHFPSRRGGEKRSKPLRIRAARLNRRVIDSIFQIDEKAKIFTIGDFNDNPDDESIANDLVAGGAQKEKTNKQMLYNPYQKMFEKGHHTLVHWGEFYLFDQIIMSKSLAPPKKDFHSWQFYKANIFNPAYLITQKGRYKGYPYRSFSNSRFTGGFSDHYPVFVYLLKKEIPQN